MRRHIIDEYKDGFNKIPFCKVCSAEEDLDGECSGEFVIKSVDKKVDKKELTKDKS